MKLSVRSRLLMLFALLSLQVWFLLDWLRNSSDRIAVFQEAPLSNILWYWLPALALMLSIMLLITILLFLLFYREKVSDNRNAYWPAIFVVVMAILISVIIAIGDQPVWTWVIPLVLLFSAKMSYAK